MTAAAPPITQVAGSPGEAPSAPAAPGMPGWPVWSGALAAAVLGAAAVAVWPAGRPGSLAMRVVVLAAWAAAGVVLARQVALRRVATIVSAGASVGGAALLGAAGIAAGWAGARGDGAAAARAVGAALLPALALHLLLALPAGQLGTRARRRATGVAYGASVVVGVLLFVDRPHLAAWPLGLELAVAIAAGLPASNRRYVAAPAVDRQRMQWFGCALAVLAEVAVVLLALRALTDWPRQTGVVLGAASVVVPAGLAAGASKRLVVRADRLLVSTVSATGLTGVVVAVYLLVVIGLGRVPGSRDRSLVVLSMAAAAVAAVLYLPARERLSGFANRLVYGEREAPDETLRTFGSRLSRAIPMDELLLQLAESLRKTMGSAAEVWTGSNHRFERVVSVPGRPRAVLAVTEKEEPVVARAGVTGPAWLAVWLPALLDGRDGMQVRMAPVTNSGELLGFLVVERRADDEVFGEEDERVLTELARQVGLALHNVQLDSALQESLENLKQANEDLQASRARIVATGDAERRKIERNLHDGAQQHLVALAVNLRLTKDMLSDDPEGAAEMLDALADAVKETIQELRNLAHGIYPPLLMDSGLPEALRAAANRSPLGTSVSVDGIGRYPTEVEAAVYFCCLEALQNAGKHAPDAEVRISVQETDGTLHFEVSDNGPGFDIAAAKSGHGYMNMSDRLGAIGGTVEWRSILGEGSTISGDLPI